MDEEHYFEKVAEYKLLAKHEIGQNFLVDIEVAKRIVASAELQPSDRILEIGSGAGSLSYFIDKSGAESDLIDIDEALVLKLQDDFKDNPKTHPQIGNIMRWELRPYSKIIGNLPYYITSAIVEKILLEASSAELAVLMVQKEVIARLSAKVGSEDYGPLPILLQFRASFARVFNVARTAFSPTPHVDSSVFLLRFKNGVSLKEAGELYSFVSQLFLHRRKTILNNLTTVTKDSVAAKELLFQAGIEPTRRPEELSLSEFIKLRSQLH